MSVDHLGQDGELGIFKDYSHCEPSGHRHVKGYILRHWIFNDCSICMCLCMVVSEFGEKILLRGEECKT